jgi:hypothetical protein
MGETRKRLALVFESFFFRGKRFAKICQTAANLLEG